MTPQAETFEFQTEARQLLDLMIHSVYSHKEIFLRELISNASDALDKLRFEALQDPELAKFTADPHIRLETDKEKRLLTIHDTGIGMTRDEVIRYIGTIAKSGSKEYLSLLNQAKKDGELHPELIGQFGVGFYSSFMVADKVTLVTRHATHEKAVRWESTGDGTFTLEEADRDEPGTSVTLHLKNPDEEDGLSDFAQEWTIRQTVRKYSDFVSYPIRMRVERTEIERDKDGQPVEGAEEKKVVEDETLNSMKAIWTRPESEVTDEEYNEFYKHVSHDWSEPLHRTNFRAEGRSEFRALLFIPSKAPMDLFMAQSYSRGVHLYIRRVFIMQDCEELIPPFLRFVKGVVDSEDLSLNISREILQQNRQVQTIRNGLTRKVLDTLSDIQKNQAEKYETFWGEFGRVLKEGILQDRKNQEKILDLCRFHVTGSEKLLTLQEVIDLMPEGQEKIYYLSGESYEALKGSPHLEAFREKGYPVLLLADTIDEMWPQAVYNFKEKEFQSIARGEVEIGTEEERKQEEETRKEKQKVFADLLKTLESPLDEYVKEVRLSARLTDSPACLVGDTADLSPQLEQMLRAAGQDVPKSKRILEVNAAHPILEKLKALHEADAKDPRIADYAQLLYGLATLAEGSRLPDTAFFNKPLAKLMAEAL
ncbi:molecular chaperone HtpG [bacterium]|nr:molecular chaperone HtpG [bacterium]